MRVALKHPVKLAAPVDELTNFLRGTAPSATHPNNPLGENVVPSANPSNPATNPYNPAAYTNPANPQLNPSLPSAITNPSNPDYNVSMPGSITNPSNPQRNPNLPGAITNPSNPLMNPALPKSITNPSNPMNNPDMPTPSVYPRPEGVSPDASLPPSRWAARHYNRVPPEVEQTGIGHALKFADNFTNDSREWPDPTQPRPSQAPTQEGCTCPQGEKLNCPIHGLYPEKPDLDHTWSVEQANPVGFPQDAPRAWTQAISKRLCLMR